MAQAKRKPERRPEERPPLREVKPGEERREQPEQPQNQISRVAVGGLALSVVALFLPVLFALIAAVTGIALGVAGLGQIRRGESTGSWIAWSAIVIGGFVAILALFIIGQLFLGATVLG